MSAHRRSTTRTIRTTASEVATSLELEKRVSRLELMLKELREANAVLAKRTVAVQAQLDHLIARISGT